MKISRHLFLTTLPLCVLLTSCKPQPEKEAHDDGAHAAVSNTLSPQALASMQLDVQPIQKQDFIRYETVQGVAELPPLNTQPLYAPVSGRVQSIQGGLGSTVNVDDIVVTLLRDPLPRVQLVLTEDLLKPASEEFHETAVSLRKAAAELDIVLGEIKRLNSLNRASGDSLVPRQQVIELQYQEARARKDLELLMARLKLHGLGEDEIKRMLDGQPVEANEGRWKASLEANGLWSASAQQLYEALPEAARNLPWNVAGIGELGAMGLLSPELISWVKATPKSANIFINVAGMLQAGHSLEDIKNLQAADGFSPTAQLKAPVTKARWDIQAIHARPGEHVAAGDTLVTLIDPSILALKIQPAGRELALLRKVIQNGGVVKARPLIKDSGLRYTNLAISHIQSAGPGLDPVAYLSITNQVMQTNKGHRSWAVQPGTRYVVEIPVEVWKDVWVLPADAVTEDGADSIVFIENGDSFSPAKVTLRFKDEQTAVLGPTSDIFPGDPVATRNAFGLALGLNASSGGKVDPHAGHNH
ncbi:MAG: multidrug efflux pump subunit AcrA (membrane-fusion protein) [Kiritimatiellia bacterium]|jgi:multidrug efflux pump subunit AcrA (membrane-fusion protein)